MDREGSTTEDSTPKLLETTSEAEEDNIGQKTSWEVYIVSARWRYKGLLVMCAGITLALISLALTTNSRLTLRSTDLAFQTGSVKEEVIQLLDLGEIAKNNFTPLGKAFTSGIQTVQRGLQDISDLQKKLAQEMGPLVLAECVIDVYNAASLMAQLGAIITGTVSNCDKKDRYENFLKHPELVNSAFQFKDSSDQQRVHEILWRSCNVGIESSVATAAFVAAFLANAGNSCAESMKAPPNADATCARDIAFLAGSFSWLAAAAEVIISSCPPNPLLDKYPELARLVAGELVGVFNRRLSPENETSVHALSSLPSLPLDLLDQLGPLGNFIYKNHEAVKKAREEHHVQERKEHEAKCAVDVTGVVGFAAAVGVYMKAGTLECPAIPVGGQKFQMGCSMDIAAVTAGFLAAGGYIAVMAVECPEDTPPNPQKAVCASGIINVLASLAKMVVAFSDVARSCAPKKH